MVNEQNNEYLNRINLDYSISRVQDMISAVIHMVGFGLNFSALALLIVFSALDGNPTKIVSLALYGSFCSIYLIFSVLYHALAQPAAKKLFRIFEISGKYLLIAGVSIPLTLVALGGNPGWLFFGLFMATCLLGIILAIANCEKLKIVIVITNILIVLILIAFIIFTYNILAAGLKLWLGIAFGLLILGVLMKDMKGVKFNHAFSHLCYVLSTVCLFFGFFFYLI